MVKHTIHTKALSRFLQILDGSFPSGAFVHSFGLEPHIVLEQVSNTHELKIFLENLIIDQYQGLDFVFAKKMYAFFEEKKLHLILKEDRNYFAMLSYEYAKASKEMGHNYLKQIDFNIEKKIVKEYFNAINSGNTIGNELGILSAYAYELDMDTDSFLLLWCKKNMINIAISSLKISRIKPSDIQKVLFEFDDILEKYIPMHSKNINSFNPLFEEVIYQHRRLEPKLFVT